MEQFRYFIHIAYNGKDFSGWQIQPVSPSVQQALESALSMLLREKISVTGAGRTDSGVHARNYYAHFGVKQSFNAEELKELVYRMNRVLPPSVAVFDIFPVDPGIHARFSAVSRTYRYYLTRKKNPFLTEFAWRYEGKLDIEAMKYIASLLPEYTDFSCFSKKGSQTGSTICYITESYFIEEPGLLIYHVKANRFLRNMVRAIAGTMIDVGKGFMDEAGFRRLITSGSRSDAGESVPAHGLFLEDIEYPENFRMKVG
jgi:tRNA pseudouridine38-40 synthase